MKRDAYTILRDFADASGRLSNIAKDWREGQFRRGDLTDAANTIEGLRALLVELRQGEVQQ